MGRGICRRELGDTANAEADIAAAKAMGISEPDGYRQKRLQRAREQCFGLTDEQVSPEERLSACSFLIEAAAEIGQELAMSFCSRAQAHEMLYDEDLAI